MAEESNLVETQPVAQVDPRILRSRRMLLDALDDLLAQKSYDEISIQEIAAKATLNRATFYLHYPDKAALLKALTDFRFRKLMERRGISFTGCDGALHAIALGVCDYLTDTISCVSQLGQLPVEASIIAVIEGMIREGLEHHDPPSKIDPALLAATVAWAVFGAAREWFLNTNRVPAEVMAGRIEALTTPLFLSEEKIAGVADWQGRPSSSETKRQ